MNGNAMGMMIRMPSGKSSKGFTLIELMVVVATIGIILCLSLALPIHSADVIRAKISEALSVAASAKIGVAARCIENPTIGTITAANMNFPVEQTKKLG